MSVLVGMCGEVTSLTTISGKLSLLMKTVERAHTPATLWEKIELDANYSLALEQVSKTLRHWYESLNVLLCVN